VSLFPTKIVFPHVLYYEPFYEFKEDAEKNFFVEWVKVIGDIKESLSSNISGFLEYVLSKFGYKLIGEIINLTKADNYLTLEVGKMEMRINEKKDTETLLTEITTLQQEREKLSKRLVDTILPDFLPVKYKYYYSSTFQKVEGTGI